MSDYPLHYTVKDKQMIRQVGDELLQQYGSYPVKVVLEVLINQAAFYAVLSGLDRDHFINRCAEKFDKKERDDER